MNKTIRNILAIARLESQRKKRTYKPKTIVLLVLLLILFFGTTFILFQSGFVQQNDFYETYTLDEKVLTYLQDSQFVVSAEAESRIIPRDDRYVYNAPRAVKESAAQGAFLSILKETNAKALELTNQSRLLYINITPLFREELIDPPRANDDTEINISESLGETATLENLAQNEDRQVENSQETEGGSTNNQENEITPTQQESNTNVEAEIQEMGTTRLQTDTENTNQESIISQARNIQTTSISPEEAGLTSPSDINTFGFVKDLFIFLQILFILNLASGLFGTSIMQEKINQRSSLLFMGNVTKWEFIIGKTLPYFIPSFILLIAVLAIQNASILLHFPVYIIIASLIILFLAVSALNGLLARNHKEYSFLNVFSISGLSLYLLIPAFLSNISELSYASLLTPLTFYSQGLPVSGTLLLFVIPAYVIISLILLHLASQAWNFERLYQFSSPFNKILLLLRFATDKYYYLVIYGMASVAFAWLGQLIIIAFLITNSLPFKIVIFLVFGAFVEEYFRNMIVYAMAKHNSPLLRRKGLVALLIGLGFVIAEKGFLLVSIAPYLDGFQLLVLSGAILPFLLHAGFVYAYIQLIERVPFFRNRFILATAVLAIIHATFNAVILGGLSQIQL